MLLNVRKPVSIGSRDAKPSRAPPRRRGCGNKIILSPTISLLNAHNNKLDYIFLLYADMKVFHKGPIISVLQFLRATVTLLLFMLDVQGS